LIIKKIQHWLERIWSFAFGPRCREEYQKRITLLFEGITNVMCIQEGTRASNPPSTVRNHSKKSPHLFNRHLVFMNITPRKEEGLYTYFLRVGGMFYSFRSGKPQHNIPLTLKEWVHDNLLLFQLVI
jgi:hypothetical protein